MSLSTRSLPPRFDVFDSAVQEDPYPAYARLRQAGAVGRGGPGVWVVSRYLDVSALLRDPRVGHGLPPDARVPDGARPNGELRHLVAGLDPPRHTCLRSLLRQALDEPLLRRLDMRIEQQVLRLIDGALERQCIDVVGDLAVPLQTAVAAELLGIPEPDRAEVARHATELGRVIIRLPFVTVEEGNGEAQARWLRRYVADLVAERRRTHGSDVISSLLAAADAERGPLQDAEIIDNAAFLFFAGFETAVNVVTSGCAALARYPVQLARLRSDPSLIPMAVEETIRYEAPIQWVSRLTAAPIEIDGRTIRPGRVLLLVLGSANRDERQFPYPDRFDVGRRPNPHLSFGGGPHYCLGAHLARSEAATVFSRLLERCATIEPAGDPVVRRHPTIRGYARVPISLRPA
jgi:cytochrome P450